MITNDIFTAEVKLICDETIRSFTEKAIGFLPEYFFKIPSSSSGKFHPPYALGEGGLVRHTKAAVNIAYCMFENTTICGKFTSRHKDLIIAALLLHDGLKSGRNQEAHTVSAHPVLVTEYLEEKFEEFYSGEYTKLMKELFPLIESHMGQWNTTKEGVVHSPLPASGPAKYVHMCDYLASRKFIEINFNECIQ